MLVTSPFGTLADGSAVTAHTLSASPEGIRLTVLDLGATVARLRMPVPGGGFADVVLGLGSAADYASADNPYLGATVGRYANRIAGARFTLDGTAPRAGAPTRAPPACTVARAASTPVAGPWSTATRPRSSSSWSAPTVTRGSRAR